MRISCLITSVSRLFLPARLFFYISRINLIKIVKLTPTHYYHLFLRIIWILPIVPVLSFSEKHVVQNHTLYLVIMTLFKVPINLDQPLSLSLTFQTLRLLKITSLLFYKMFLILSLSDVYLWLHTAKITKLLEIQLI